MSSFNVKEQILFWTELFFSSCWDPQVFLLMETEAGLIYVVSLWSGQVPASEFSFICAQSIMYEGGEWEDDVTQPEHSEGRLAGRCDAGRLCLNTHISALGDTTEVCARLSVGRSLHVLIKKKLVFVVHNLRNATKFKHNIACFKHF